MKIHQPLPPQYIIEKGDRLYFFDCLISQWGTFVITRIGNSNNVYITKYKSYNSELELSIENLYWDKRICAWLYLSPEVFKKKASLPLEATHCCL